MTDLEKALLFIDCNKCLEEYMLKLELEGKSPRFWLLDRFWRMKRLYEAGPCLMKLIGLKRSERVETFAFNVSFAIITLFFLDCIHCGWKHVNFLYNYTRYYFDMVKHFNSSKFCYC